MILLDYPKPKLIFLSAYVLFATAIIIVVCISVYAYYYAEFTRVSDTSKIQKSATNVIPIVEVNYTDSGFIPQQVTVPLGSTVVFRNETDIPLWVASDPHPRHGDLPGFDAGKDFFSDEAYQFTFTKLGTFGYHNHRRSLDRGTVRVFDPAHPLPDISKTKSRQAATRDALLSLLSASNTESIFRVVDAIESDPALSSDCHDVAHDVGHRAYELFGFSAAMTYTSEQRGAHTPVQDICAGGYVHGIMEEVFLHQPELVQNPGILCDSVPEENRASCFHGVGHAIMFANERNVEKSIAACKNVPRTTDAPRCFEGVWMEMYWGSTDHYGEESLGWDLEKPLEPCRNAENSAKPACYIYAPFGFLRTSPKDYSGAINLCTQSELNPSDTRFCLRGVGIAITSHLKAQQLERTELYARSLTTDEQKSYFYEGVIGYARLSGIDDETLSTTCSLMTQDELICRNTLVTYR